MLTHPHFVRRLWACALFIAMTGCGAGDRPNLLLVTFDTTRADRIGCYGNEAIQTPNVDRLCAEGVRFDQVRTSVPITLPSHSTIMTGKYPMGHGVRDNGLFVLGEEQHTLAEILRDEGYATAAAVGSYPLTEQFGIGQGFDLFDDHVASAFEDVRGARVVPREDLFFDERRAARVNEAVYSWLESNAERPFFLWLHYFDPHQPFEPPPPYDEIYATDLYNGEIAYADEALGNVLRRLEELGVDEETIVVFTADHGEGLGEHEEITHSLLNYDSTLRVPLVVRDPGGQRGAVVEHRVGTVDILPTVLDLLRIPIPGGLHGRSLAEVVRRGPEHLDASDQPLYAESLSARLAHHWGELRTLYEGDYKYIFGPRPELYDIASDPGELVDLAASEPKRADSMQRQLAAFIREHAGEGLAGAVPIDDETRNRLAALGYLHASGGEIGPIEEVLNPEGMPPQDRASDSSDFSHAKALLFDDRPIAAREIALRLVRRAPENPSYVELLASAELQLGRLEAAHEALARLETVQASGVLTARLLLSLSRAYHSRGDHDRALDLARQSLADEPTAGAHLLEASILLSLGREDDRRAALDAALALDAGYAPARVEVATIQDLAGDREAAAESFERALRDEPYFARGHYNYGTFLIRHGDTAAARDRFERAVELDPTYLQPRYALLVVHHNEGRTDEARREADQIWRLAPESREAALARRLLENET